MTGLPERSPRIPAESSAVSAWLERTRGTQSFNDSPFPMHLSPVLAGVKGASRSRPVRRHPSTPSNLSLLSRSSTSTPSIDSKGMSVSRRCWQMGIDRSTRETRAEPAPGSPRRPVARVATNPAFVFVFVFGQGDRTAYFITKAMDSRGSGNPCRLSDHQCRSPHWFPRRLMQSAGGPVPLPSTEELRFRNRCTIGETGDFAGILERLAYRPHVADGDGRDARIAVFRVAHGAEALFTRDRKSSRLPEPCASDHFEAGRYPSPMKSVSGSDSVIEARAAGDGG